MIESLVNCIRQGKLDAISGFIKRLKNINIVLIKEDDCNLNLLHIAAGIDSVFRDDVVNLIVKAKELDINKPSGPGNDCWTAAHITAIKGYSTTLKCLLDHGADPYLLDIDCNTVWDVASANNNHSCIRVLENAVNSPPSPLIDDSIYFSMSSLGLIDLDQTIKLSDQSSVVQVTSQELQLRRKNTDKFPQKAPKLKSTRSPPRRPTADASYSLVTDKSNDTVIYTDPDFNVTLVGVKDTTLISNDSSSTLDNTTLSPLDSNLKKLTDSEIYQQLQRFGESPGPVNKFTRDLYLRKLGKIISNRVQVKTPIKSSIKSPIKSPLKSSVNKTQTLSSYPQEINNIVSWKFDFVEAKEIDKEFMDIFSEAKGPRDFFNYLLLDPRKTCNLSQAASEAQDKKTEVSLFVKFIKAIFYIGKGKNNRPYMHLYEAALPLNKRKPISAKVKRIIEIWDQDYGVISLHFPNGMTSEEAFARESLMINAIDLDNLTNIRLGQNKVHSGYLTDAKKKVLGAYCLWKAYKNLILNGERQIKRFNITR